MRLSLLICIILAFLQTSIVPINLTLIYLLPFSFMSGKSLDYLAGLVSGVLIGLLFGYNLGIYPMVFVSFIFVMHLVRRLPLSNLWVTFFTVSAILVFISRLLLQIASREQPLTYTLIPEIALTWLIFLILRMPILRMPFMSKIAKLQPTVKSDKLRI